MGWSGERLDRHLMLSECELFKLTFTDPTSPHLLANSPKAISVTFAGRFKKQTFVVAGSPVSLDPVVPRAPVAAAARMEETERPVAIWSL